MPSSSLAWRIGCNSMRESVNCHWRPEGDKKCPVALRLPGLQDRVGRVRRSRHPALFYNLTGSICQIFSAYSLMVLSDEKYPMLAMLCIAALVHFSG